MSALGEEWKSHWPRMVTVVTVLVNVCVVVVLGSLAGVVVDEHQHVLSAYPKCAEAFVTTRGLPPEARERMSLGEPAFVGENTLRIPFTSTDPGTGLSSLPASGVLACRFAATEEDKQPTSRVVSVELVR